MLSEEAKKLLREEKQSYGEWREELDLLQECLRSNELPKNDFIFLPCSEIKEEKWKHIRHGEKIRREIEPYLDNWREKVNHLLVYHPLIEKEIGSEYGK